jgi:hypothetical protein
VNTQPDINAGMRRWHAIPDSHSIPFARVSSFSFGSYTHSEMPAEKSDV